MTSANVGDLMNAAGIPWGWFYGDFPESSSSTPITSGQCLSTPSGVTYNSHYAPFMYYASTSNQHHLPPSSAAAIGTSSDQANHNYSLVDFQSALAAGNLPAVTFLKAPSTETGHPSKSKRFWWTPSTSCRHRLFGVRWPSLSLMTTPMAGMTT
jgi:phospholipase C